MKTIIPEIEDIVNFYTSETVGEMARETGFVQREPKLNGTAFLCMMTQGLYHQPDATLTQLVSMGKDMNCSLEVSQENAIIST